MPVPNNKYLLTSLALVLVSSINADSFYTTEFKLESDDNVTLATEDELIRSTEFVSLYADYNISKPLKLGQSLTYTAHIETFDCSTFEKLDRTEYGLAVSYRNKLGIGDNVPILSLGLNIQENNYHRNSVRDAEAYSANIGISKRLNDRVSVRTSLAYHKENASDSEAIAKTSMDNPGPSPGPGPGPSPGPSNNLGFDVFDLGNTELKLSTEYVLGDNSYLNFRYLYRDGDIASYGDASQDIINFAEAAVLDGSFFKNDASDDNKFVYRIGAKSHVIGVSYDYVLSERSSLSLAYDYQQTNAEGPLDYDRSLISLKFVYGN